MPYKDIEKRRENQRKLYLLDKENNPEKLREKERKKYKNNPEKLREKGRISYHRNKEKNREKRNERNRKRYHDKIEYRRKRREENPEVFRKWDREKRKNDPLYKFKKNFTNKLRKLLKSWGGKNTRTITILGLSINDFRIHLENQFEPWMSWDNYGLYKKDTFNYGWDIDHTIPTSTATTHEDMVKLNHYTNLKPLCSKINRDIKRDIIPTNQTNWYYTY